MGDKRQVLVTRRFSPAREPAAAAPLAADVAFSECHRLSLVEPYEGGLIEVLVACLSEIALGLEHIVARLVELSDRGLSLFILSLHECKGIL